MKFQRLTMDTMEADLQLKDKALSRFGSELRRVRKWASRPTFFLQSTIRKNCKVQTALWIAFTSVSVELICTWLVQLMVPLGWLDGAVEHKTSNEVS